MPTRRETKSTCFRFSRGTIAARSTSSWSSLDHREIAIAGSVASRSSARLIDRRCADGGPSRRPRLPRRCHRDVEGHSRPLTGRRARVRLRRTREWSPARLPVRPLSLAVRPTAATSAEYPAGLTDWEGKAPRRALAAPDAPQIQLERRRRMLPELTRVCTRFWYPSQLFHMSRADRRCLS